MTYETAPATLLVATHCAACARPLVDAESVETGMGPDCRKRHGYHAPDRAPRTFAAVVALDGAFGERDDVPAGWTALIVAGEHRAVCNRLVHAIAAGVVAGAELPYAVACLDALGYGKLAAAVSRGLSTVHVEADGADLLVKTPFSEDFNTAARTIPGARWDRDRKVRVVPAAARTALWVALRRVFPAGTLVLGARGAAVL